MMRLLLAASGLQDSYPTTHPTPPSDPTQDKTCDTPHNTWSASKPIRPVIREQGGKRLDYILTRPHIRPLRSSVTLTYPIPGRGISISDHFAYEATLSLPSSRPPLPRPGEDHAQLSNEVLTPALALLSAARYRSRRAAATHLLIFVLSVLAIIALAIGGSFQDLKFLNWIFILAAAAAGACKLHRLLFRPETLV
jgi:sphingomyelin phosphodiesterase 2